MEKAILKTLIYADIFDYPLKINEVHKWLVGRKATIRQVEKVLKVQSEYYFLPKRKKIAVKRKIREKESLIYLKKAKLIAGFLKIIPWIKLVGISGGLAVNNASRKDDIDFFIITGKNRLWLCRLLILGLLSLTGQRRKKADSGRKIAGKLCINILLEEDKLEQKNKDIFTAHEVLQMKPLWYKDNVYSKYLEDNSWAFKFLPNWIATESQKSKFKRQNFNSKFKSFDLIEKFAKWLQLKIMQKPKGMERIEDGALYFHPNDCRLKVLAEYRKKLATLDK